MDRGLSDVAPPTRRRSAGLLVVRPLRDPSHAFDATELLVDAIAREIARRCGGNVVLNRLEAAAHLASLLEQGTDLAGEEASTHTVVGASGDLGR